MNPHVAARIAQELQTMPASDNTRYTQLSEREQEVLHLIAEGFPNSEIARRLIISEKTVKSHVSNILSKLHLLDRTQAAVFAWREGLVSGFPLQYPQSGSSLNNDLASPRLEVLYVDKSKRSSDFAPGRYKKARSS